MVHYFLNTPKQQDIPQRFPYPFHHSPHHLAQQASRELQLQLGAFPMLRQALSKGKMLGVLVIKDQDNRLGYLAAYSGNIAHGQETGLFVPAVFDLLKSDGFFKKGEMILDQINEKIAQLVGHPERQHALQAFEDLQSEISLQRSTLKTQYKQDKALRDQRRATHADQPLILMELKAQSQFQKAELKRKEQLWKEQMDALQKQISVFNDEIVALKQHRKSYSQSLQTQIFQSFNLYNARGEQQNLLEIFAKTPQLLPPAGAGECAGPKLLQYAYLQGLRPLALAEFWQGTSPKEVIRQDGAYYPPCMGKCYPILGHMLQGLEVDPNPEQQLEDVSDQVSILWQDEHLLAIDKPSGMLSAPGKSSPHNVLDHLQDLLQIPLFLIHRLDRDTSGILLLAKNKSVYALMQKAFESRAIEKTYTALLNGHCAQAEGEITLPLSPDYMQRPRQQVDYLKGKLAHTRYTCIEEVDGITRILFRPITGRTHQLRVHAAHPEGLDAPILGDPLYGKPNKRLCLHATTLQFQHPLTQKVISLYSKVPF